MQPPILILNNMIICSRGNRDVVVVHDNIPAQIPKTQSQELAPINSTEQDQIPDPDSTKKEKTLKDIKIPADTNNNLTSEINNNNYHRSYVTKNVA